MGEQLETLLALYEIEAVRIIAGITGGILLLGIVATFFALASHWKTRSWPRASGRITHSTTGFELRRQSQSEQPRNHRIAKISYEYQVGGRTLRSNRIWPTGTPPEEEVERLLTSFPVDAKVTVFHHPTDLNKSALELNGPPPELAKGCLAAALMLLAVAAVAIWLATSGIGQLQGWFPDGLVPAMLIASAIGLLLLIMFVGFARQNAAIQRWPTTGGRITLSQVEEFKLLNKDSKRRRRRTTRTAYMPIVEYSYSVGGRDYLSRSVWADTEVSGSRGYAEKIAAKYQTGAVVVVHYDPEKPQRAALETGGGWVHWLMLVLALIAFGVAAATSGYFTLV